MVGVVSDERQRDRFRGTLVGTAIGDALGAPVEGRHHVDPSYLERARRDPAPLRYTDDTAMTIAVARSLARMGEFDGADVASTLADIHDAEPWRGYGPGPAKVFARLRSGVPWDEAGAHLYGGEGSFGNGAAMRVAPVAVFTSPDLDGAAVMAERSARITHHHPEGIDGAVAQAVAIAAILPSPPERLDLDEVIEAVRLRVQTDVFRHKLAHLHDAVAEPDDQRAMAVLGNGIEAHASVPTALYCALTRRDSFEEAVLTAIGMGGDADTIGAMTGALAGALHGLSAVPEPWSDVEGRDELIGLADELAAVKEKATG